MSWSCPCTAINGDEVAICSRCGHLAAHMQPPVVQAAMQPGMVPPPPNPDKGIKGWQICIIAGVLVFGGVFGTLVAVKMSSVATAIESVSGSASASSSADTKSVFQESFDNSFKRTCRMSATRSGNVSAAVADSYCDCAL